MSATVTSILKTSFIDNIPVLYRKELIAVTSSAGLLQIF